MPFPFTFPFCFDGEVCAEPQPEFVRGGMLGPISIRPPRRITIDEILKQEFKIIGNVEFLSIPTISLSTALLKINGKTINPFSMQYLITGKLKISSNVKIGTVLASPGSGRLSADPMQILYEDILFRIVD